MYAPFRERALQGFERAALGDAFLSDWHGSGYAVLCNKGSRENVSLSPRPLPGQRGQSLQIPEYSPPEKPSCHRVSILIPTDLGA